MLEDEDLIFSLANGAGSRILKSIEISFHSRDHGRRTTDKDLGTRARTRKVLSNVLFRDKANTTLPVRRRIVQDVIDLEAIREHGNEVVEFSPEQNVLLVDVGVDEGEFGWVTGIEKGITDDLKHGGDTSSSGNETELGGEFRGVSKLALGSLDTDFVANLEKGKVTRDIALLIGLHNKVKVAKVVITSGRSVAPDNVLSINLSSYGDVLSSGKTQIVLWIGETETIERGVGGNLDLLDERELSPGIRAEDRITAVMLGLKKEVEADDDCTAKGNRETQGGLDEGYQLLY